MKRFNEGKLLLVITDGQRFGNVISCQAVKTATNDEGDLGDDDLDNDMMLNDGGDEILDGDEEAHTQQQEKVEYQASLLLGDRKQQDFLVLFAQTLLRQLSTESNFSMIPLT